MGLVLVISTGTFSRIPLTLGASSWLLAIGISSADTVNWYISAFLLLWGISFPILLLVFYVMACRKTQMPFVIIVTIDAIIVLLWAINCLATDDIYAFEWAGPDAVASILYSAILITSICLKHKRDGLLPPEPKYDSD